MGRILGYSWIPSGRLSLRATGNIGEELAEAMKESVEQPLWPRRMLGQGEN